MNEMFNEQTRGFLLAFLLMILPWIVIIIGLSFNIQNAWYYILSITWFGSGLIFYSALR
ncbi:MAG: hypothetical protein KKC68_08205 [Candidatus Thermoplasmatota archaeon]|nr:hypothetical protein [Candidatus Thermoplasmatota archaeon]MBU1941741.1 hypothetical protein [Candidatus Thermoplasmatota archaeon]